MLIPTTLPNLFIHSATYVVRIVAIRYTQLIRYIQLYVRRVLVIKLESYLGSCLRCRPKKDTAYQVLRRNW